MDFQPLSPPAGGFSTDSAQSAEGWSRAFMRRGTPRTSDPWDFKKSQGSEVRTCDEKLARLEAALFVASEALSTRKLVQFALLADVAEARTLIDRLNEEYDRGGSAFRAERVATGYRLLTRPVFARWLNRLHHRQSQLQLSPPAMETLTIIAYRQPIKRVDVESIRGVQSAEMIKHLMERGLVRIAGEEDSLGRPYLYGTTRLFLETFGLRTLDDLPRAKELRPQAPEDGAADSGEPHDTAA